MCNRLVFILTLAAIRAATAQDLPITGTHIAGAPSLQAVRVIDRAELEASGYATFGDFLQRLPEQGGAEGPNVNNGGDGSTQLALHNLGSQRTLILVDGKRWVSFSTTGAIDLSTIPNESIERIEILESGGSAVYGSGAIGGVVNIITRKKLEGTEASALGSLSSRGDARQYDLSVHTGVSGEKSSFFLGAGFFDRQALLSGARGFATSPLAYNFSTGAASRSGSAITPSGTISFRTACITQVCRDLFRAFGDGFEQLVAAGSCPTCVDGFRPVIASDLYNYQQVSDLVTPSQQLSLFSNAEVRFSPVARAYFQGSFVNRQSNFLLASDAILPTLVQPNDPANPFGALVMVSRRITEAPQRNMGDDVDSLRGVVGLDGGLPSGLTFNLSFNYGRTTDTFTTTGTFQTNLLTGKELLAPAGTLTAADLTAMGLHTGISRTFAQMASTRLDATQTIFTLGPAREATLAAGYEYRAELAGFAPDPIAAAGQDTDTGGFRASRGSFHVNEGYAELDVPVLTAVDLRGAVRGGDDSGFGSFAVWSVGGRWQMPEWLSEVSIRGGVSSNYRAPSVSERAAQAAVCASGPCPSLQLEKSLNGTAGISFEPKQLPGSLLSLDYWNISLNQVAVSTVGAASSLQSAIGTSGLDLGVRYARETPAGRFGLRGTFSYLFHYDVAGLDSAGNYDLGSGDSVGGVTPRLKFDAAVDWRLAALTAALSSRFIGGFDECQGPCGGAIPAHRVPAYATFDLSAAYTLGCTTLNAGVRNLANAVPPKIYTSYLTFANPAYDFVGRAFYARATQKF